MIRMMMRFGPRSRFATLLAARPWDNLKTFGLKLENSGFHVSCTQSLSNFTVKTNATVTRKGCRYKKEAHFLFFSNCSCRLFQDWVPTYQPLPSPYLHLVLRCFLPMQYWDANCHNVTVFKVPSDAVLGRELITWNPTFNFTCSTVSVISHRFVPTNNPLKTVETFQLS